MDKQNLAGALSVAGSLEEKVVAVTGADGFIGSAVCQRLLDEGAAVVCLVRDRLPRQRSGLALRGIAERVQVVYGDVCDPRAVEALLAEPLGLDRPVDVCVHLAAQALVNRAYRAPGQTWRTNVLGTLVVAETCQRLGVALVGASSDKAYGALGEEFLPYQESAPLSAVLPYDATKACADILMRSFAMAAEMPVAVARCGNTYGPGDLNFSRIVPDTIRALLRGRRPIIRSDGTAERDYVYVDDVAEAYVRLAEYVLRERPRGEPFNFGSGRSISVLELVRKICEIFGTPDVEPEILGTEPPHIPRQWLDSSKAQQVLGWRPHYSLEQGLEKTIAWYREQRETWLT